MLHCTLLMVAGSFVHLILYIPVCNITNTCQSNKTCTWYGLVGKANERVRTFYFGGGEKVAHCFTV